MKTKIDFVTNSSCASFVIHKKHLSAIQIELIKNHIQAAEDYSKGKILDDGMGPRVRDFGWLDPWNITELKNSISGETSMDNFDMLAFLIAIGVNEDHIQYEGCY